MSIPLLTFRCIAGRDSVDGEEKQQGSQDGDLHDDCCVERTADGMLQRVTATDFIPGTVRRKWRIKYVVILGFF